MSYRSCPIYQPHIDEKQNGVWGIPRLARHQSLASQPITKRHKYPRFGRFAGPIQRTKNKYCNIVQRCWCRFCRAALAVGASYCNTSVAQPVAWAGAGAFCCNTIGTLSCIVLQLLLATGSTVALSPALCHG